MCTVISSGSIKKRYEIIREISIISERFGDDSQRISEKISDDIKRGGVEELLNHLRLCSSIPESYKHDSSEEKLYSKYTDIILSEAYKFIGLKSIVLTERADAADVEACTPSGFIPEYSFVADAKAFRLSRTAKNQKDFKIQALDNWKKGKPYAMVVCPLYQLPMKTSQIYEQASARSVCIFSYAHLALLVRIADIFSKNQAMHLLKNIFSKISQSNLSKNAQVYWSLVHQEIFSFHKGVEDLWKTEKKAVLESISISQEIALEYLASERERIMKLSHEEAIRELVYIHKIESKIAAIEAVSPKYEVDIRNY